VAGTDGRLHPAFIDFHGIDTDEILDPLDAFRTFNEFFYRRLRPGARPLASPDDPRVLVSPADSRMLAFPTIDDATRYDAPVRVRVRVCVYVRVCASAFVPMCL
jgi:phosphatidylserine decarboxylase